MTQPVPDNLQAAFQVAWDAANLVATLSVQQATLMAQLATCNTSLAAAMADRDVKELAVVNITRDILGANSLPPTPPA